MKTNISLFAILAIILIGISSCQKEITPDPTINKKMSELVVSESFDWESTVEVKLSINTQMEESIGSLVKISVYDASPMENGNLIATGSAGYDFPYINTIRIPSRLTQLYLKAEGSKGSSQIVSVPVSAAINYTFDEPTGGYKSSNAVAVTEPDCNTGCDQLISGNGAVVIKNGLTYCVTGSFNGTVTFEYWNGGGTLKVCGTASIGNTTLGNNSFIVVTAGGAFTANTIEMNGSSGFQAYSNTSVTINNLKLNTAGSSLTNYSNDFELTNNFAPNGTVNNNGSISINGNLAVNGSGHLVNTGNITTTGYMEINNSLTNDGSIEINGRIDINNQPVINNCRIITHDNFNLNSQGFVSNGGYLKVDNNANLNANSSPELKNHSMWSVKNLIVNSGQINGTGSLNTIRTENGLTFWGSASAKGALEFADNNAVITGNQNAMTNGAMLVAYANATNYIPVSTCNPEGIGTPAILDADGDGVADNLDEYPSDPTRAYNSYFPNSTTWGSIAFEDLWPSKGDYDFNDLVTKYQYKLVTNAQNNVVDVIGQFHVIAVGASFQNGFGIQFDGVTPSQVASVTGCVIDEGYISLAANGLENNQAKAVVIPWDNAENVINRAGGSMFNTIHNGFVGTSDLVTVNIHFNSALAPSVVGTAPFNPFIIRDQIRGHEIHMIDNQPTSLMNTALFGTEADVSNPAQGKYYRTQTNLPWAIAIPEVFAYPLEKAEITEAHLHFAAWAESEGTSFVDWYQDKPGYRNTTFIY